MKKRLIYGFLLTLLALCVLFVAWEGSFKTERFKPDNPSQTLIFWAVSSLTFLLMIILGWQLFHEFIKLYVERQSHREGSRIKTKLVVGALTLSFVPVFFLVLFMYYGMNHALGAWFSEPLRDELQVFNTVSTQLQHEMADETNAQAALLAAQPDIRDLIQNQFRKPGFLEAFAKRYELESIAVYSQPAPEPGSAPTDFFGPIRKKLDPATTVASHAVVTDGAKQIGSVTVTAAIPVNIVQSEQVIARRSSELDQNYQKSKEVKKFYTMLMLLITLFVLFVATWIALFLSKQISIPITALLEASSEVRKGNLTYRVGVRAADELGTLVRAFNQMTQELETSSRELDRRRRFTEAILESIPTGVLSLTADGSIKRTNRALSKIFPAAQIEKATRLEDLFSREDTAEVKYLMKRARRTGVASRQLELRTENRKLNLAVTVSALEEKLTSGFVVVLEDTSELLRAQKSAAWHEVARRVAHEIKNPLTPIALSAERITRQMERVEMPAPTDRILRECAATINRSVESVKTLVDEFSQFARFPSAQPVRTDLNELVGEALAVFRGRLEGVDLRTSFTPDLPAVNLDREQFQRVVVNLVDNAAEAMQDSLMKKLYVTTQAGAADTVELVVADSGPGVSPDDKEKLFLPYFSTKNRGTGLGLAIVSHIVAEHNATIRVEDNLPTGARFTVEIPVAVELEPADGMSPPATSATAKA